jgi:hypothetical protein
MRNSFDSRLSKIENTIDEILNPYEDGIIILNKSTGETKEGKIAEL